MKWYEEIRDHHTEWKRIHIETEAVIRFVLTRLFPPSHARYSPLWWAIHGITDPDLGPMLGWISRRGDTKSIVSLLEADTPLSLSLRNELYRYMYLLLYQF